MSYVVDESKIQLENFSRAGQKKKEMKMGKSNYWTIWCPISQFVEHFDFLAHIYILLLQNKVRDNKSLNAGIQQAQNYQLLFKTRSSWLNCALRDDEAVFWASIGHYETVAVSNW